MTLSHLVRLVQRARHHAAQLRHVAPREVEYPRRGAHEDMDSVEETHDIVAHTGAAHAYHDLQVEVLPHRLHNVRLGEETGGDGTGKGGREKGDGEEKWQEEMARGKRSET